MSQLSEFLLYAAVFRLAIIATGTVCIVLGYRLFAARFEFGGERCKDATFNAKLAGMTVTLKNAAPGAFFALFGVIVISVMLAQGNPELTLKRFDDARRSGDPTGASEFTLRGGASTGTGRFDDAVKRGLEYDEKGDTVNAAASYEEAMTAVATPMNQLAWDYLQLGKAEDGLPLAQLAAQLCPGKAPFLDTLAEILFKEGKRGEAVRWMAKASALDPRYQGKLSEYQHAGK